MGARAPPRLAVDHPDRRLRLRPDRLEHARSRLSDWREANRTNGFVGLDVYKELRTDERWSLDLRHLFLFTVAFIVGTLVRRRGCSRSCSTRA